MVKVDVILWKRMVVTVLKLIAEKEECTHEILCGMLYMSPKGVSNTVDSVTESILKLTIFITGISYRLGLSSEIQIKPYTLATTIFIKFYLSTFIGRQVEEIKIL
jgi:hypothetical protein